VVDLLTLSACETALNAPDANGAEIESFSVIAQMRGAKIILATLWSISDEAAPSLMTEIYRQLQTGNGAISKAEALRRAQIALLKKSENGKNRRIRLIEHHLSFWANGVKFADVI